jgi:hypothetical protein
MKEFCRTLLITLLICALNSCSSDDGFEDISFGVAEIVSVSAPDEMVIGDTANIEVAYLMDSGCESFAGFDVTGEALQRNVLVVKRLFEDPCSGAPSESTSILAFQPQSVGDYQFSFIESLNEDGEQIIAVEHTIRVTNN